MAGDGADWFSLCGCIGDEDQRAFVIVIGLANDTSDQTGEFCAFANDLDGCYGNNSGHLKRRVKLV